MAIPAAFRAPGRPKSLTEVLADGMPTPESLLVSPCTVFTPPKGFACLQIIVFFRKENVLSSISRHALVTRKESRICGKGARPGF